MIPNILEILTDHVKEMTGRKNIEVVSFEDYAGKIILSVMFGYKAGVVFTENSYLELNKSIKRFLG